MTSSFGLVLWVRARDPACGDDRAIERRARPLLPPPSCHPGQASVRERAPGTMAEAGRSEERRVGKECVSKGRSGWWPDLSQNTMRLTNAQQWQTSLSEISYTIEK